MLPETVAAPHHVLPQPRLAFMDARRDTLAERRTIERSVNRLLIHGVAGLVQCREQRITKVVFVDAGRDADVTGGKPGAERMTGEVEPAALEIVAETLRNMQGKIELRWFGKSLPQNGVIHRGLLTDRMHQGDKLAFELVEQGADRGR